MHGAALLLSSTAENSAKPCTNRITKANMRDDTTTKKGMVLTPASAVKVLVWQNNMPGRILLLKTAYSGHTEQPPHSEATHRPDVGTVVDFMGQ